MAGKSTYMRQTAIIVLMAQMGSFVPAESAEIGLCDAIFTRVGASDDLAAGQSTFMVEMSEVAEILKNATKHSLLILDEIGRGTSTFDGMSIARAVLEYVADKKTLGAKALFSTHYHELTSMENELQGVKNYNVAVKKRGDDITFLRRIIPGEADGIFYDYDTLAKETGEELASSSFGQTFKVTPIQICTAVAAAVNGGRLMQPYVVSQVLDPEGNIVSTTEPVVKRQVISEQTSETMRGILEKVVGDPDGSGKNAYVPGYRVGGKTGTSEKLDAKEGGEVTRRIASFMGIAPSNDPQVLVLVILDEPQMQNIYGSVIAAPVVGAIMSDILPYLKVEPQYTEAELSDIEVKVPYVTGGVVHDALSALTARGLSYKLVGDGVNVTGQIPSSGTECPKGTKVILYTDGAQPADPAEVPDVLGLSAQQANRTILNAGFNIRLMGADIEGKGVMAVLQDPLPGTAAQEGTIVTVTFADASDAFTAEENYEAMQENSSEPSPGAASPAGG